MSKLDVKTIEYFREHDKTGKTSYTKFDKEKILNDFFSDLKKSLFFSAEENATKVLGDLKGAYALDEPDEENLKLIRQSASNAVSYIGYTDGNFKYVDYILIGDFIQKVKIEEVEKNVKVFLYWKIPKKDNMGNIMSALSDKIADVGNQANTESNLYKMMKRNGYTLEKNEQKKFLFGKGHMVAGPDKVNIKRDLDILFGCMKKSKKAVEEKNLNPLDFTEDLNKLHYFKFKKIV